MSFSENWELAYSEQKQMSHWPWSDLVSLYYRYVKKTNNLGILEIGCGSGANIPFLLAQTSNFYGLDGSKTAVETLRERFPNISHRLQVSDFTKSLYFDRIFDIVIDRASITHNNSNAIQDTMSLIENRLAPGGLFFGIHWFSIQSSYFKKGFPIENDEFTRYGFEEGPFKGISPVHFFSREEIDILFKNFRILYQSHINITELVPRSENFCYWNIVAQKK